ncbi:MAG: PTS-dependent dihydroxyacetone kinase operon regulatory protein [Candidatus Celerinatantimonas neptuna]|nr:MAG: PTS-dependent dihydroxyacetone kinase operon regulatory protein [Candidatus Celerinatantimonas neptuna]
MVDKNWLVSRVGTDPKVFWNRYIVNGRVDDWNDPYDPHLKEVWQRCQRRQRYNHWPALSYAKGVTFSSIKRGKSHLIDIAIPVLEDIFEFLENRCAALLLTDESGCTLSICADKAMLARLQPLGLSEGVYWREATMGNNAISSAIKLAATTETVGYQHFNQALHSFACYASPLFNSRGDILGTVALFISVSSASKTAQGLIYSASKEIAGNLYAEHCLSESNQHLSEMYVLLEGVEEGVLAWNSRGVIHYLNQKGSDLLDIQSRRVLGCHIEAVLHLPQRILLAIENAQELPMFETTIESNQKLISLLISLQLVKDEQNQVHSYIVLMHPIEHIRQLVHHQAGNMAHLTFDDIACCSEKMQKILKVARHAAKGRGAVLLHGEEGLGKSDLAQAIHNASERREQAFIAINCQAIPRGVMTTEFLGADPSSDNPFPSKFELANGGTLFLEHIESLNTEVQAALLHLLKTGLVNRLDHAIVPVDVRIIASSDMDLSQYVDEHRFGRQLMYELQSFDIEVPPLRERSEDITWLVTRYLKLLSGETGHDVSLSDDAMAILIQYQWPGNSRELRNVLERSLSFSDEGKIEIDNLPDSLVQQATNGSGRTESLYSLAEAEKKTIITAGQYYYGKPGKMCSELGISRTSLWRKLKYYKIDLDEFK